MGLLVGLEDGELEGLGLEVGWADGVSVGASNGVSLASTVGSFDG